MIELMSTVYCFKIEKNQSLKIPEGQLREHKTKCLKLLVKMTNSGIRYEATQTTRSSVVRKVGVCLILNINPTNGVKIL